MDELELLKKDWQKDKTIYPQVTAKDIYRMIHSRSSSIVKWIFIISLLEFAFWLLISFLFKDTQSMQKFDSYNADNIWIPLMILGYVILAYFFYRFYMNYRNISVTDSAKNLMETILRTRRTVRNYVAFNLIYLFVTTFVALGIMFKKDEDFVALLQDATANGEVFKVYAATIFVTLIALAIIIGLILVFYYLIYGLLLKKLNKNYGELKKLEV